MVQTVGVVGLGYVGLTLTAALADHGYVVHGADTQPAVVGALRDGRPHIFEPGVADAFARHLGSSIFVSDRLPDSVDGAVLCVSTPVDGTTRRPDLSHLTAAARQVAAWCTPRTLVVVRSTVPVGTSRRVVLPALRAAWGDGVRLVMAPERTIQGQALRELVDLPQVIGGLDEDSLRAGKDLFAGLAERLVPVSSLEAAELVKLSNNCHTDLIYSYGNEVALIAERYGLDPLEVIRAANIDYPRPDLSRPGYVGGGCLSKDPYIMIASAVDVPASIDVAAGGYASAGGGAGSGREPFLVGRARDLNEYLPAHVAARVIELILAELGHTDGARLAVLGWAYKGWPPTDDMRGTPIATMMPVFRAAGLTVLGHDPMVAEEVIRRYGGRPVSLAHAFTGSDAVLVVNDHPDYRAIRVDEVLRESPPRVLYDSWRILDEKAVTAAGVRYAGIGYLPPAPPRVSDPNGNRPDPAAVPTLRAAVPAAPTPALAAPGAHAGGEGAS